MFKILPTTSPIEIAEAIERGELAIYFPAIKGRGKRPELFAQSITWLVPGSQAGENRIQILRWSAFDGHWEYQGKGIHGTLVPKNAEICVGMTAEVFNKRRFLQILGLPVEPAMLERGVRCHRKSERYDEWGTVVAFGDGKSHAVDQVQVLWDGNPRLAAETGCNYYKSKRTWLSKNNITIGES